jgi:hypothetical protein
MLTKSIFIDDGIIKVLIAAYRNLFHMYLVQRRDLQVNIDVCFRGGWEVRVVRLTMLSEVIDSIGTPRGYKST